MSHKHDVPSEVKHDVCQTPETRMNKRVLKAMLVIAACTFGSVLIVKQPTPVSQRLVRITASYRTRVLSQNTYYSLVALNAVESPQPIAKILHNVYLDGLDN